MSKDADFQGSRTALHACAQSLGGTAKLATFDDNTPSLGLVIFKDSTDCERQLDFLSVVGGLKDREIASTAIPITIAPGVLIKVMHPVLCLESRAFNVINLAQYYANEHGLKQLRASVFCAREFISDLAHERTRDALRLVERVFRLSCATTGVRAHTRHGIDVFAAVQLLDSLPDEFRERRYPQMKAQVEARRTKAEARESRTRRR